ncbi:MAG TPA: polysaccharide biosynthesis/export family protein [Armatimonadota bacterium]|nr:polysaccharide biosynthesis/export family protein [Armatimonadota bacterium]
MRPLLWIAALLVLAAAPAGAESGKSPLTAGDRLQVRVAGEMDLSKEYIIDESGQIKLDLVGSVKAAGLTESEFQAELTRQLSRYIRNPSVTVLAFQKVAVGGGVRAPGGYDFPKEQPIRLMDAITRAGGFAERARKNRVLLVRKANTSGTPQTQLVDVQAFLKKGKTEDNPVLGPNDLVYVDVNEPRERPRGVLGLLERALPLVAAFL